MYDYWEFLSSYAWRKVRSRIIERDAGRCVICGSCAHEVHHHEYDDAIMRNERDDLLVSLCKSCHQAIEFGEGKKRDCVVEKRRVFDERRVIYSKLNLRGVDVVCEEFVRGAKSEFKIYFSQKYWGEHFISILDVLCPLRCVLTGKYGLSFPRGSLARFESPKGIYLFELPKRKRAISMRIQNDVAIVSWQTGRYELPLNEWNDSLSNNKFSYRIRYTK